MNPERDEFRDAMALWPSGVCVVAVREDGRAIATTVASFMSLSLEPPTVLVSLAPNATVRPFLDPGREVGISILASSQRRVASVFADPLPVGPDPFEDGEPPLIRDALVALHCIVERHADGGDHLLVVARVHALRRGAGAPLIRYARRYRSLDES